MALARPEKGISPHLGTDTDRRWRVEFTLQEGCLLHLTLRFCVSGLSKSVTVVVCAASPDYA